MFNPHDVQSKVIRDLLATRTYEVEQGTRDGHTGYYLRVRSKGFNSGSTWFVSPENNIELFVTA